MQDNTTTVKCIINRMQRPFMLGDNVVCVIQYFTYIGVSQAVYDRYETLCRKYNNATEIEAKERTELALNEYIVQIEVISYKNSKVDDSIIDYERKPNTTFFADVNQVKIEVEAIRRELIGKTTTLATIADDLPF